MPGGIRSTTVDQRRRGFLTGEIAGVVGPFRPPWSDESSIARACTRCNACIHACPQSVLIKGKGGFPEFEPNSGAGACTFCGVCAAVCPADVFDTTLPGPWNLVARIAEVDCLAYSGIHCAACSDACDDDAIRLPPRIGGPPRPAVQSDRCTGCGGCVGCCPANAITLIDAMTPEAA